MKYRRNRKHGVKAKEGAGEEKASASK